MTLLLLAQVIALAAHGESVAVTTQEGVLLDGRAVLQPFEQPTGAAFSRDSRLAVYGGKPGSSGAQAKVPSQGGGAEPLARERAALGRHQKLEQAK